MNIKFNYLYRDAGNYKKFDAVIFSNPSHLDLIDIEKQIREKLIDLEFFEPSKINLPHLIHEDLFFDQELDHTWNEFESVEETDEPCNDLRTINEFIEKLKS